MSFLIFDILMIPIAYVIYQFSSVGAKHRKDK